jgi:hypothetical protein
MLIFVRIVILLRKKSDAHYWRNLQSSEYVWEDPKDLQISKFWANSFVSEPWITQQNETIWDPKARIRFEVMFKKFHPRINLTTLFLTKSDLLNTINSFLGHENCSLTKSQKPSQGGNLNPWELEFQNSY